MSAPAPGCWCVAVCWPSASAEDRAAAAADRRRWCLSAPGRSVALKDHRNGVARSVSERSAPARRCHRQCSASRARRTDRPRTACLRPRQPRPVVVLLRLVLVIYVPFGAAPEQHSRRGDIHQPRHMRVHIDADRVVEPDGSNRRPPACKAGALPAELWPLIRCQLARRWRAAGTGMRVAEHGVSGRSVLSANGCWGSTFFLARTLPFTIKRNGRHMPVPAVTRRNLCGVRRLRPASRQERHCK